MRMSTLSEKGNGEERRDIAWEQEEKKRTPQFLHPRPPWQSLLLVFWLGMISDIRHQTLNHAPSA